MRVFSDIIMTITESCINNNIGDGYEFCQGSGFIYGVYQGGGFGDGEDTGEGNGADFYGPNDIYPHQLIQYWK